MRMWELMEAVLALKPSSRRSLKYTRYVTLHRSTLVLSSGVFPSSSLGWRPWHRGSRRAG
jgi:hypothetical protein